MQNDDDGKRTITLGDGAQKLGGDIVDQLTKISEQLERIAYQLTQLNKYGITTHEAE